jgi:predicted MFS family arabinose efflux permease
MTTTALIVEFLIIGLFPSLALFFGILLCLAGSAISCVAFTTPAHPRKKAP